MSNQLPGHKNTRPSLRTVAEAVGLSATAVSLALRGDSSIPAETRKRVIEAAQSLGYKYVSRAKKKAQRRLRRLVYVVNDYEDQPVTANPFYGYILNGAEEACRALDAGLSFVMLSHNHPETADLPAVLKHDLDGILLASPYPKSLVERIYRESGRPIVLIDNTIPGGVFDSVMADDFGGGYQVTQHLLDFGHRDIVMITGHTGNPAIPPSFSERYKGYQRACWDADITPRDAAVLPANIDRPTLMGVGSSLKEWLMPLLAKENPPTALFCAADFIAVSVMAALNDLGYQIPKDISVVGFDGFSIATQVKPTLTSVHTYKRAIARVAVERLLARIDGDDAPALNTTLVTKLIARESTGTACR
jgi:DNA-binding LacI/PurR family transcriptional regulator